MDSNIQVHPYCDVCGKELSSEEIEKHLEVENYEFPICDDCFNDAMKKIIYILDN